MGKDKERKRSGSVEYSTDGARNMHCHCSALNSSSLSYMVSQRQHSATACHVMSVMLLTPSLSSSTGGRSSGDELISTKERERQKAERRKAKAERRAARDGVAGAGSSAAAPVSLPLIHSAARPPTSHSPTHAYILCPNSVYFPLLCPTL